MNKDSFTIHTIEGYIESLFLIEYPDKLLLLDSGCRSDVSIVSKYIKEQLNRPMSDLKLVIITHAHPDHSGGAYYYQKRYGIPIAGTWKMNEWYSGFSGFITQIVDIFLTHYVAYKRKKSLKNIWFPRKLEFDHILEFDQPLPGFSDWRILSTPGHTLVDLTVFHKDESIAYIADCIIRLGQRTIHPYPINHPEKYKASLSRLRDLNIKTYLLAHHGSTEINCVTFKELISSIPNKPKNHRTSVLKMFGIQ